MPDRQYSHFLELSPDAVVIIDGSGVIEYVNEQAMFMFRYRREQIVGKSVDVLLPERYRGAHIAQRFHYMEDPRRRMMGEGRELYGLRSDNVEFAVDVSLAPIFTIDGQERYAAAIRDVTAQKQAVRVIKQTIARTTEWLTQLDTALDQLAPGGEPHP